jgi:two-component system response regulator HydG
LPLPAQVKLLRTLQEGEVRRVGANDARLVDVRVIAATNVDLRQRIREGKFREDLYYRLDVIQIALPALRDRREDVALLAGHFLRKYARRMGKGVHEIAPDALRELEARPWPGNVRELENAIERAVVLARGDVVTREDLPRGERDERAEQGAQGGSPSAAGGAQNGAQGAAAYAGLPYAEARRRALLDFERDYVATVLARAGGNISQAAREAGLDRSNFKRVLRRAAPGEGPHED